jgi:DNA-directed RNA polymerase specialized sigma24 family protein
VTDWDAILGQPGRQVRSTAHRLLGNHSDTSDCFQETFLSALSVTRRQQIENWGGFLQQLGTIRAIQDT